MIKAFENLEVWFVTGAQLLYGGETVKIVDGHSKDMVDTRHASQLRNALLQMAKHPLELAYK